MVPEVGGRGAWSRWTNDAKREVRRADRRGRRLPVGRPLGDAYDDIDAVGFSMHTYAATPSHAGRATTVRVVGLPDVDGVRITCDGEEFAAWRRAGEDAIELDLTIGDRALVVRTGYDGAGAERVRERAIWTRPIVTATDAASAESFVAASTHGRSPPPRAVAAAEPSEVILEPAGRLAYVIAPAADQQTLRLRWSGRAGLADLPTPTGIDECQRVDDVADVIATNRRGARK